MNSFVKATAAGLALLATFAVLTGNKMAAAPSTIATTTKSAEQGWTRPSTRFLQQVVELQAPVGAPTPATEVTTAAPAVEIGLLVPGPEGEQVSASAALFTAILNRDAATIERLFALGASTDVYSPTGSTPLIEAIRLMSPEIVSC